MVQDPAKPFFSNIAVSDVFMPVDVRPELRFGVVGVDHFYVVDAEDSIDFSDGLLDAGGGGNVVAGRMTVAGIDTESNGEIGKFGGKLPHDAQFFEMAAQHRAGAGSVFEQHGQLLCIQTLRGFGYRMRREAA